MRPLSILIVLAIFAPEMVSIAAAQQADPPPDAEEVLLDVYAHYRDLESYAGTTTVTVDMKATDQKVFVMPESTQQQQTTLRFARPDRLYYDAEHVILLCDGDTVSYAMPMMMQYVQQDAPSGSGEDAFGPFLQMTGLAEGAAMMLFQPLGLLLHEEDDAREFVTGLKDLEAERVDEEGESLIRVTATMSAGGLMMMVADDITVPLEVWIDPQQRLITRNRMDMTAAMNAMMQQMAESQGQEMLRDKQYERMVTIIDFEDPQLHPEFGDEAFTYDWEAEGYEKVDADSQLGSMFGMQSSPMLGADAPEIESETLDGDPFTLSDLRGNVVVLDFWATWCAPCVRAMPEIQRLHERFADQPVRVVGINQDRGNLASVRKFLEKKDITFLQVKDAANQIGQAYKVSGIPTTVIIDPRGVVQAVHVGFMPGAEKELTSEIETLLEGGTLVTEENRESAERLHDQTQEDPPSGNP